MKICFITLEHDFKTLTVSFLVVQFYFIVYGNRSYLKFSRGYPVIPINFAFPLSLTFCRAGNVSLMIISRLGANSMSCTCIHKIEKCSYSMAFSWKYIWRLVSTKTYIVI